MRCFLSKGRICLKTVVSWLELGSSCQTLKKNEGKDKGGCVDKVNSIKSKGLKKRSVLDRKRQRIKSSLEKALEKKAYI